MKEEKKKNANETKKRKENKIKQNSGLNLLWRAPKCSALRDTKSHGPEGRYLAGQGLLVGSLFKKRIPTLPTQPVSHILLSSFSGGTE